MHIAVTGASGFIGRHFCEWAKVAGHRVTAVSRDELQGSASELPAGIQAVVHLAGRAHVMNETASDPGLEFRLANVGLTGSALDLAKRVGARRFVFISSAGVLGNSSAGEPLGDDSPLRPYDGYSNSKIEAERLVMDHTDGQLTSVILRPPVVYGADARGNFARILRAVAAGWPLPVGALTAQRSMIGIRNLCDATLLSATARITGCATFLVADRETISIPDLTRALASSLGKPARVVRIAPSVLKLLLTAVGKSADIPRLMLPLVLRPARARQVLGWDPPYCLTEELDSVAHQWLEVGASRRSR